MKNYIIAIDGPAASGKSTIAKIVADKLNISYIDSGAMFRTVAFYMLNNNIDIKNKNEVVKNLKNIQLEILNNKLFLNGIYIAEEIRQNIISQAASDIAVIKEVRDFLLNFQRKLANNTSIIMDGRDIGTVVFPHSDYKFFLIASSEERARRRYNELNERGEKDIDLDKILEEIRHRDLVDSTREHSPLIKAKDAIEIDTTNMSINEVVDVIINKVKGD